LNRPRFRFIAISQGRIGLKKTLGSAIYLHEFLTDHQTDPAGWVYYGKPFGYAWICAHWPGDWLERPKPRTLKRHMSKLKALRLVEVHREPFNSGMRIRLLQSVKFAKPSEPPACQLPLLASAVTTMRRLPVNKPVGKRLISGESVALRGATLGTPVVPDVAPEDVKNQVKETIRAAARAHAMPSVEKTPAELDARRRFLLDQADMVMGKVKTSG
jgi:hypothetical protein